MNKIFTLLAVCLVSIYTQAQEYEKSYELSNTETGTKEYVARDYISLKPGFSYKASGDNHFTARIDECLLFPPTDATYGTPEGAAGSSPSSGGVVGSIPGRFNVSPTGAATYTIPIEVPKGINGMEPNISLVYNSQAGNGIAGWGWNIGGLSMITRVSKNYYHDYDRSGIIWDKSSPISLDGNRLFIKEEYGNDSIEYSPEKYLGARIVGYDIQNFGPQMIKVYTQSGQTLTYGKMGDESSYNPLKGMVTYVPGTNIVMDKIAEKKIVMAYYRN